MKSALPHITFVIHDVEGGVASMNHQIIENAPFRQHFNVHIILWRSQEEKNKPISYTFENTDEVSHFSFSRFDNYYLVLRHFSKLLNRWPGLLVTNDGIELEATRRFGARSVLFSIVHDFYNLTIAIANTDQVDYFICHTEVFTKTLMSSLSLKHRVKYLPHGVKVFHDERSRETRPIAGPAGEPVNGSLIGPATGPITGPIIGPATGPAERQSRPKLKIVSISRLIPSKGVLLFSEIDDILLDRGVEVEWIVIGSGEAGQQLREQWKNKGNIQFHQPDTSAEVFKIARSGDLFISPSSFEGYGIALLEAMSCGLVPVIYRLPVGIYAELPVEAGFSVDPDNLDGLAQCIIRLHKDRELLARMRLAANRLVVEKYDIAWTSPSFLTYFREHSIPMCDKDGGKKRQSDLGLLDRTYIPNFFARFIKRMKRSNS